MTIETPERAFPNSGPLIAGTRSPGFLTRLFRQRLVPVAGGLILLVIIAALFSPLLAPDSPTDTSPNPLVTRSRDHLLGADQLGRDILSRLIFGARVSLMVGVVAVGLAMAVGVPLGLVSGYFGGPLDHVLMRLMDAIIAFPAIILALAIVGAFGSGMFQVMVAIGVGAAPVYSRLTRAQVLSVREEVYVLAGRSMGASNLRIVMRHILPNVLSPLIVQGSLGIAFAILAEAGLSFLGVGVQPPTPTWGGMLSEGLPLVTRAAHVSMYPGLSIFVTVLAINTVGDAMRDVLDPRLRGSR